MQNCQEIERYLFKLMCVFHQPVAICKFILSEILSIYNEDKRLSQFMLKWYHKLPPFIKRWQLKAPFSHFFSERQTDRPTEFSAHQTFHLL